MRFAMWAKAPTSQGANKPALVVAAGQSGRGVLLLPAALLWSKAAGSSSSRGLQLLNASKG